MRRAPVIACLAMILSAGAAASGIVGARYDAPTTRYAHGVLGDAVEWGALVLTLSDGGTRRLILPRSRVFEDTAPRLADVDGDGDDEVIVVETSLARGARLAIYDDAGLVAATPHTGRPNRWLAPVGVADLDGDGHVELAYVDRPHLARVLRVWRYRNGALYPVADLPGVTNHRIGWDFIPGGLRDCGQGPEMIVASADWARVVAATFAGGGRIMTRTITAYEGPSSLDAARACP
ncbi:FG-GAP-like repeat-containing protein [Roseovarius salis]|uniref:FG-GAP-like repeat-containing protein n=1 Tax=Roseovarius salis TaxID=3376063 RepID=UPI0037C936E8